MELYRLLEIKLLNNGLLGSLGLVGRIYFELNLSLSLWGVGQQYSVLLRAVTTTSYG